MKKAILLVLCTALVFCLAACAGQAAASHAASASPVPGGASAAAGSAAGTQIANPFEDCDTLDDAAKIAGFEMTAPDHIDGYSSLSVQAIEKEMIQLCFADGDNTLCLRKAVGTNDVSGDYNSYSETSTVEINGLQVTVKGDGGLICVAVWTDGGYSYSIGASGTALAMDTVKTLVSSIR